MTHPASDSSLPGLINTFTPKFTARNDDDDDDDVDDNDNDVDDDADDVIFII